MHVAASLGKSRMKGTHGLLGPKGHRSENPKTPVGRPSLPRKKTGLLSCICGLDWPQEEIWAGQAWSFWILHHRWTGHDSTLKCIHMIWPVIFSVFGVAYCRVGKSCSDVLNLHILRRG